MMPMIESESKTMTGWRVEIRPGDRWLIQGFYMDRDAAFAEEEHLEGDENSGDVRVIFCRATFTEDAICPA